MLFEAKRLPGVGCSLGQGTREFEDGITGNTPELLSPESTRVGDQANPSSTNQGVV
jgi:Sec-independent protein translocase protein TatA